MKAKITTIMLTFALSFVVGCHQQVSPVGPTASTIYQQAATVMDDVATDVQQAQQTVTSLHTGGAIPDATYKQIQQVFGQVGNYGQQVDALLAAQASAQTINTKITAAIQSLMSISVNAAGVDAATAQQIQSLVQLVTALLNKALALFPITQTSLFEQEIYRGRNSYRYIG